MPSTKILLLSPPVTLNKDASGKQRTPVVPPMGLAYLAGTLVEAGYPVKIVDCLLEGFDTPTPTEDGRVRYGLSDKQIKELLSQYQPGVIGISCVFSNLHPEICHLAQLCKEQLPSGKVVVGGGHPTIMPEKVMRDSLADFVMIGEGEFSFLRLVTSIENQDSDWRKVDGLVYRDGDRLVKNPKANYIENLDSIPFPAWHLLNLKKYNELQLPHGDYKRKPFVPIITSRGCPAKCIFCASKNIWGQKYRARSAENVLAEIRLLIKNYGIKEIHFEDDNLTLVKERALKIFNGMIEEKMDLTWTSPNGLAIFTLDEELIDKMKESGGFSFALAIESGDQEVLTNIVKKPLKLDRATAVIKAMRERKMKTKGFFIIGLPGETKEQISRTIEYAENAGLGWVGITIATPLPGSELYDKCVAEGYINPETINFNELKYGYAQVKTPEFTPEEIQKIAYEANLRINFFNNYNMRYGNYEEAITDFERVVHLYPNHLIARLRLGDAYQAVGRKADAIAQWQKILEMEPGHTGARERLNAS